MRVDKQPTNISLQGYECRWLVEALIEWDENYGSSDGKGDFIRDFVEQVR